MFWFSFSGPSRCSGKGLGLSLLSWGFGGFPLQSSQISQDVWCYSLTTDLQFQLLALIGLDNWGVLCDSPSTCLSEKQYILVPESCLSLLGQMVGSVYNLVPRAFPLENGRSAKALGKRIKLTAKTDGTKILLVVMKQQYTFWISFAVVFKLLVFDSLYFGWLVRSSHTMFTDVTELM